MKSKERNYLRKEASKMAAILHVGKDGLSENTVIQADDALKARELIKGKILQNSLEDVREVAEFIAEQTGAEVITTIGNTFVLYRRNPDKDRYGVQ